MKLGLSVLVILSVLKNINAVPIIKSGPTVPIGCSPPAAVSNVPDGLASGWAYNAITMVNVCAVTTNRASIAAVGCADVAAKPHLALTYLPPNAAAGTPHIFIDFELTLTPLQANDKVCHLFTASDIAAKAKFSEFEGATFGFHAMLIGTATAGQPVPTITASVATEVYIFDKAGNQTIAANPKKDHLVVICRFISCIIEFKGKAVVKRLVQRFNVKKQTVPQFVDSNDAAITADMIAVVSVHCDGACPDEILASGTPGLGASFHVIIGSVLVLAISVLQA